MGLRNTLLPSRDGKLGRIASGLVAVIVGVLYAGVQVPLASTSTGTSVK
jgi:hypothetical protein